MRFGSAEIQLISDGSFRMDGGAVFGGVPKAIWSKLIPIPQHLPAHYATACDLYPLETLQAKRSLLAQAENDRWLLIFGHGAAQKSGYLRRDDRRWVLDPCPLEAAPAPSHAAGEAAAP